MAIITDQERHGSWRFVGFDQRIGRQAPGITTFGGSCAICGTAIKNCYLAQNRDTGTAASAQLVTGTYGLPGMILDASGASSGEFVPHGRKRRGTMARRGYTYGVADFVMRRPRKGEVPSRQSRQLTTPTVDAWGEPIRSTTPGEVA